MNIKKLEPLEAQMTSKQKMLLIVIVTMVMIFVTGCDAITPSNEDEPIIASGIVEAIEVNAAAEVSGKVTEIFVEEGHSVGFGEPLLLLENEILDAQLEQAIAAVQVAEAQLDSMESGIDSAEAAVASARVGLEMAKLHFETVLKQANIFEAPLREFVWDGDAPDEFELPTWYFNRVEEAQAAEKEIQQAAADLDIERANLEDVLDNISNADFRTAENRLLNARAAFLVAETLLDKDVEQNGREAIEDYIQSLYDTAEAELESAQKAYDSLLSDEKTEDVLEARARVEVAYERYKIAVNNAYSYQTGEHSLEVIGAKLAVDQANAVLRQSESALKQIQANISVAEKNVEQAEASLNLIEIQRGKLTIHSPSDGVVLSSIREEGELVPAGSTVIVIGQLDELRIKVFLPEDIYGNIKLGQTASVKVDSFPGETFEAEVIRIADQAEFTPRNIQTEEDRKTTVFAVELSVTGSDDKLKPGMPADVTFLQ